MSLTELAEAEVAAEAERRRERERLDRERRAADARAAVEAVLVRVDGSVATLAEAGLTQTSTLPDGSLVWHDGTTGLMARRMGGVWGVFLARNGARGWTPAGHQVHSLLDVAARLRG